ncbi:MAG: 16S rRNA (cytosine(1402)-N(4))-methyltransferase RsmH [Chthoniobacterales bacterium]|nr:16S rRNA (cytosine(1402)-N(4))-methyltransferase RsmH [Chthoniobacterales bacterium]
MTIPRRRPRYPGKNPRRFEHKYKEHAGDPETIAKVLASGKTPAGTHVPIMVDEILDVLGPQPGDLAVDCTLGHGGHARHLLARILPGGHLLGLDADPVELPRTGESLRAAGFGPDVCTLCRSNFAGLPAALAARGIDSADIILADLGVSSMQLDTPARGFSTKLPGPLDMRMNPERGVSAAQWLARVSSGKLSAVLSENADEPHAELLGAALAGGHFAQTTDLAGEVRRAIPRLASGEMEQTIRRVFQAVRIEVNEEFAALDALLRTLPLCLRAGGRVAILTFHSGEDRRVKKAFQNANREGVYREIARDVIRASPKERRDNPRSTSAKLRWARRA